MTDVFHSKQKRINTKVTETESLDTKSETQSDIKSVNLGCFSYEITNRVLYVMGKADFIDFFTLDVTKTDPGYEFTNQSNAK
ncbi:hypothetical protein FRX31_020056 [Thalictrum thalictroides]|uniref:Uncharacterized protein n=1 Tax=Thalictrum thalictroides TaxID=46969 RepID=A0A7J6W075_THATH|nr:hypothetical protein FRX31_020056 [Thalictrum thalictroides]